MHARSSYSAGGGGIPLMTDSPRRAGGGGSSSSFTLGPKVDATRDWESFTLMNAPTPQRPPPSSGGAGASAMSPASYVKREGPPSVAVLGPAVTAAETNKAKPMHDHQAHLAFKRDEYRRRLEAEERGEQYVSKIPYSNAFAESLPYGPNNSNNDQMMTDGSMSVDFIARSQNVIQQQVVGTKEEMAWLHPPQIPHPVGWNGYWDLVGGHELLLQVMAVSGVNQDNSPSLVEHFMYPELLSCVQRLQYGSYLVHYQKSETPHERYFYIKSMPLANKGQYCPFLCWSMHRHAYHALDCIPLVNVMWVSPGAEAANFQKYRLGKEYIKGPFVGKKRSEMLVNGCMTIWIYDGKKTRTVDVLATDPLVYTMWMKLLEDVSQMNAALDVTGHVRGLQRDLDNSLLDGSMIERTGGKQPKSSILNPIRR